MEQKMLAKRYKHIHGKKLKAYVQQIRSEEKRRVYVLRTSSGNNDDITCLPCIIEILSTHYNGKLLKVYSYDIHVSESITVNGSIEYPLVIGSDDIDTYLAENLIE